MSTATVTHMQLKFLLGFTHKACVVTFIFIFQSFSFIFSISVTIEKQRLRLSNPNTDTDDTEYWDVAIAVAQILWQKETILFTY